MRDVSRDVEPAERVGPDEPDDAPVDGRRLRRERNVAAVIDAVLEMFAEETLEPSIERAAQRSGLSLRSVYRYFPTPESLAQAAIDEMWRRAAPVAHLSRIGEGPFEERVASFAAMRVRLYEHLGNTFRAARAQAPHRVAIRADLDRTRRALTAQFERHFAAELDALPEPRRVTRASTADLMSQLDAIDLLRRARGLTIAEATDVVAEALRIALDPF